MINSETTTKRQKLEIIKDKENENLNATYAFNGEDHTLGNLLRNILIKEYIIL